MPRSPRVDIGGIVYHVLNRANARLPLFESEEQYGRFERLLADGVARFNMRLLCYCLMPNHWHLVLWPHCDGDLSEFMRWVTLTHTQRLHAEAGTAGQGHIYQGRYKSFVVAEDEHFLTVCRYVERNPLRAGLVDSALDWEWSSLHVRTSGRGALLERLSLWPVQRVAHWVDFVNEPQTVLEEDALAKSIARGAPYGARKWAAAVAHRYGIESTLRARGRPRRKANKGT